MSDNSILQKRCSKCGELKPATTEYFRKASKEKSGLTSRCKDCLKPGDAKYREEHPDHGKQWYEDNKDRINAECHEIYFQDPEKYRQIAKDKYWQNPEHARKLKLDWWHNNPDKAQKISKTAYDKRRNDPEKWAAELKRIKQQIAKDPERRKLIVRKSHNKHIDKRRHTANTYHLRHPEKARAKTHKRIAMKKNAEGVYTHADLLQLYEDQNGLCAYCGQNIYWSIPRDIHVDHIQPLTKGGSNWPDNLALTCHACNESKGNLLLPDWMSKRGW